MAKSDDELAEFYKFKAPKHFAGWKTEEVIEYAREKDPDFENKAKVFYGDGTAEKPKTPAEAPTYPEEQYKNQNPEVRTLDTAQRVVESALPEPVKKGLGKLGQGIAKVSESAQKPVDKLKESPTLRTAVTMAIPPLGALMAAADAGKVVNSGGDYLLKKADDVAEGGKPGAAMGVAALGGALSSVPSTEADILLSAVPVEGAIAPAAKLGIGTVKKTSDVIEAVSRFLPGAAIVRDAFKAGKSATKENLVFKSRVKKLGEQMTYVNDKIKQAELSLKPIKDSVTYGQFAKQGLEFQEELSKAPLVERARALKAHKEMSAVSSVADVGEEALKIADELTGVVSTTKDGVVTQIVNKYLGKEQGIAEVLMKTPEGGWQMIEKPMPPVFMEASASDLLKDRSRIGQAYMRALKSGVLDTEQSAALLKLQDVIDDGIAARLKTNPKALEELKDIRSGWRAHYQKYASKTAIAVKKSADSEVLSKISKTASAVEEAREIMPTAVFEKMASDEATTLANNMSKSADATKYLAEELAAKKGYYERLLGQNQVDALKVLAAHKVDAGGMMRQMVELAEKINGTMGTKQRSRDTILTNLRRAADTGKATKQLAAVGGLELAATMAVMSHQPGLAMFLGTLGVAPGAFMLAYHAGGRTIRARIERALSTVGKMGKAAPAADIRLIQSVGVAGSAQGREKQEVKRSEFARKISSFMKQKPKPQEAAKAPGRYSKEELAKFGLSTPPGAPAPDPEPAPEDYFEAE